MALTQFRTWLIAYDIRLPKRLAQVHRYLRRHAVPVQYSVFVTRRTAQQIGAIRAALAGLIDATVDDVRIYHVPDGAEIRTFGVQGLFHGIQLLDGEARPRELAFTSRSDAGRFEPATVEHERG